MKTLEQILNNEKQHRHENGEYGIKACKESIKCTKQLLNKDYYQQLQEYVNRTHNDCLFNPAMVLACWELINEEV